MSLSFPVSRKRIFEETLVEHWLFEHWLIEPLNKRFHKESNEVYNASNTASQTTQKEIRNFITYEYLIGLSNVERIQLRSVLDGVLNTAVGYDVIQAMSMSGITSRQSNSRRVASLIIHLLPRRSERKKRLLSPTQLLPHPLKFGHYSRNKKKCSCSVYHQTAQGDSAPLQCTNEWLNAAAHLERLENSLRDGSFSQGQITSKIRRLRTWRIGKQIKI